MNPKVLEHEMMRFKSMSPSQLLTRLYRITKTDKLDAYILTARKLGYYYLAEVATQKRDEIMFNGSSEKNIVVSNQATQKQNVAQNIAIEKKATIIVQEIEHKRALDF